MTRDIISLDRRNMTMREIAEEIAALHGASLAALKGPRREKSISMARQQAMAAIYATHRFSQPQIGKFFNRHHTTVLHAVRRANGESAAEAKTARALAQQEAA